MKPITYKYKNFELTFYKYCGDKYINVTCTLENVNQRGIEKTYHREYNIHEDVTSVVMDEEYVYLNYNDSGLTGYDNDSQYVIKFEGDSCLVIDTFDENGEHLEVIGCHDFWDDVK